MIAALIGFATSRAGQYAGIALAVAAAITAALVWHSRAAASHDLALRATWEAEQRAVVDHAMEKARQAGLAAVADAADAIQREALAQRPVREVIHNVPVQSACAASPAVRAALDELRRPDAPGTGGSAAASAK